jgi:aspartyl-tRNA(Asn)/glutamyl-tRNA(Gln) amidotransferase subunit A
LDSEIAASLGKAVEIFQSLGASIVEVSLPHSRIDIDAAGQISSYAVACYYIVAMAEASSNLARYDGVHYGHRTAQPVEDIIELFSKTRAEGFGEEVKRRIMLGTYALSAGYYDAYYGKAQRVRTLVSRDFARAFEGVDVIVAPTTPGVAFRVGDKAEPLSMYLNDVLTIPVNLAGLPGLSVPAGFTAAGLPIGLQLIGRAFEEATLLRVAHAYERATAWHLRRAPIAEARR